MKRILKKTLLFAAVLLLYFAMSMIGLSLLSAARSLLNESNDFLNAFGIFLYGVCYVGAAFWIVTLSLLFFGFFSTVGGAIMKFLKSVIVLCLMFALPGCFETVNPGHVGIVVNKMGTDRGVQSFPTQTGLVFYNPFVTTVYEYPVFVQTATWQRGVKDERGEQGPNEEVSFNTAEGLVMTADVSVSYQLLPDKVPEFYVRFRNDDLRQFTHGYLRSLARDKFNEVAATYGIEDIYGPKKEIFLAEVKRRINEALAPVGAQLDQQFGFIGAPRPPQNVIDAINAKIAATQRAIQIENELRTAQAEAKKQVAAAEGAAEAKIAAARGEAQSAVALAEGEATATTLRAEAAAAANRVLSASLTKEVLEWRQAELQSRWIDRWNGVRPSVEAGSGQGLMLQLPAK